MDEPLYRLERDISAALLDVKSELLNQWSQKIARGTDAVIADALRLAAGEEWNVIGVAKRVHSVRVKGDTFETIHLDCEPILELHDLTFSDVPTNPARHVISANRQYRFLGKAAAAHAKRSSKEPSEK